MTHVKSDLMRIKTSSIKDFGYHIFPDNISFLNIFTRKECMARENNMKVKYGVQDQRLIQFSGFLVLSSRISRVTDSVKYLESITRTRDTCRLDTCPVLAIAGLHHK